MTEEKRPAHTYKLRYTLVNEVGSFDKSSVEGMDNAGLTDALIFFSILYPKDGSYSQLFDSLDGRTGKELSSNDYWKAWALMAATLSERKDLDPFRRELCAFVHEQVTNMVLGNRKKGERHGKNHR